MKKLLYLIPLTFLFAFVSCDKDKETEPDFDPTSILPADFIDQLKGRIPMHTGVMVGPVVHGHIVFDAEIEHVISGGRKEGDKLGSVRKTLIKRDDGSFRLVAGPSAPLSHNMLGDAYVSGIGDSFTIYAKTEGTGQRGRKEYEVLYVISGRKVNMGANANPRFEIRDIQYAYLVSWNETTSSYQRLIGEQGTFYITKPTKAESYSYYGYE